MNISKIQSSVNKAYLATSCPVQSLKTFYKEGLKNPSLALILEKDEIRNITRGQFLKGEDGFKAHVKSKMNYDKLKSTSELQSVKSEFWHKFAELYPRTALLRALLVKFDKVSTNEVTPVADENLRKAICNYYKASVAKVAGDLEKI